MAQIGETELDVRALWRALWRRSWLLVILAIAAAGATYWALGRVTPLYTADTRILIEERESPLTRPREQAAEPASDFDESAIQSQVEVLRSREIAEAVIDKLDLTSRPQFDPARQTSLVRSLMVLLGVGDNPADSSIRQRVMEEYFKRLSVYPVQKSRVVGLEFSAPDPNLAAEVANTIADAFVNLQQSAKRESAVAATSWLQQEIERLRGRVADAEQAIADYRQSHGLFSVDQSGANDASNLSTQQLGEINAELARARAAHAEASARAELVQRILDEGGPIDASEEVLNSQLIQRLRERQGALTAQIAELSTTLLPTHPRIRALQEQAASLEAQIRAEARKVLASLQTAARVAAAREESLLRSLDAAKGDVSRSNDEAIELRALQREAAAQRELLESFLTRYREAAARTDANYLPADARIISRAVPPSEPSFPKKTMMSVAAALAIFLLGSALVLLAEFMSGRAFRLVGYDTAPVAATDVVEAKEEPARPVSVAAGDFADDDIRVSPASDLHMSSDMAAAVDDEPDLLVRPLEPVAERRDEADAEILPADGAGLGLAAETSEEGSEYKDKTLYEPPSAVGPSALGPDDIRAESSEAELSGSVGLAEMLAAPAVKVALFVGGEGGEGAGYIAFSAAKRAAKEKVRCILVDVGREPSKALGYDRPGLGDLMAGEASFGEVIQRDDAAHVHMIPLGSTDRDVPMARLQMVIGALTHTYDKVIVVADRIDDWPDEHVRPDLAAIVCGPDATEFLRTELYDFVLARGARSAVIVRYASEQDLRREASAAA